MKKKKKSKKAEVKEHKKAPSKSKSNVASYIVGAIIVIIIIVALVLLLKGRQAPTAPVAPTQPVEKPSAPVETEKPIAVSEKPGEIRNCAEEFAIGWPKNKLGQPCKIDGNTVTAQIMYSGSGDKISGMWFYITTTSGAVKYFKDTRTVKQGETLAYEIDVGEHIKTMIARSASSDGKSCLNQVLMIVKAESCVAG